jgi:UPF0755 protein
MAVLAVVVVVVGVLVGRSMYHLRVRNYVATDGEKHEYFIPDTISADSLVAMLETDYQAASKWSWRRHQKKAGFRRVLPGHYTVEPAMSDRMLIWMFQYGHQTPVRLSWRMTIRTREQLAARLAAQLRCDSASIADCLSSDDYMRRFGLTKETAVCLFIPDTYEVWWTMSVDELFERMNKEYNRFWNDERRRLAAEIGLTQTEVATLGSIVASETNRSQEHPIIAGLYMNRLRKHMLLQACPTVIFAIGDFSMRRVTNQHLKTDSPYNTYKYPGLPPGPIRCVSADVMDAVLHYEKNNYLYMCANPDFSGTHKFSSSYAQHAQTARAYQRELNKRKIK